MLQIENAIHQSDGFELLSSLEDKHLNKSTLTLILGCSLEVKISVHIMSEHS